MSTLYVTDTNSIISFFNEVFEQPAILSPRANKIISQALYSSGEAKLSIPSVVFIEIFDKWLTSEEFARKFYYDVYTVITQSENVEIKPIEQEVIENLLRIGGNLTRHDIHDKLILASAMMLECPLITTDRAIRTYVEASRVIPAVIS